MQYTIIARIALLVALLGLMLGQGGWSAPPNDLEAQTRAAPTQVFLPLAVAPPSVSAPETYAELQARAGQRCPQLGPDQVCYVGGPVIAQSGALDVGTPGAIADLAAGEILKLAAPTADSADWGIVRLRLRSGFGGETLDLLAFGNLELHVLAPANSETGMPSLALRTGPTPDSNGRNSSGVVVRGPSDDLGALIVNGAIIQTGGAVYLNADQPAETTMPAEIPDDLFVPLDVTVTDGAALVAAADNEQAAIQGQQVQVPFGQNGQSGPPETPIDVILHDFVFDIFVPLSAEERQRLADAVIGRLETSIDRCVVGRVRYIYNVAFWNRVLTGDTFLENLIAPDRLAATRARVPNCLSFEIEFDSNATVQGGPVLERSHLRAGGIPVSFGVDGKMLVGGAAGLIYQSHSYVSPEPCTIVTSTKDGAVNVHAGSLRVAGNRLRIAVSLGVTQLPDSSVAAHCPSVPPTQLSQSHWWTVFPHLHRAVWQPGNPHIFRFNEWRYTAGTAACENAESGSCAHVGEATYQLQETALGAITYSADTHLILVHTPVR